MNLQKVLTIGFTGTRHGMGMYQKEQLMRVLDNAKLVTKRAIHGGCVGADAEFDSMCRQILELVPEIYPGYPLGRPEDASMRMALPEDACIHSPAPYLERNREIVANCQLLIAAPKDLDEYGGTWFTIDHARKSSRETIILYPQEFGEMEHQYST